MIGPLRWKSKESFTKLVNTPDAAAAVRGVNSFPWIKQGEIGMICAVIGMDEPAAMVIPDEYLTAGK
jgi:hypothetical protein